MREGTRPSTSAVNAIFKSALIPRRWATRLSFSVLLLQNPDGVVGGSGDGVDRGIAGEDRDVTPTYGYRQTPGSSPRKVSYTPSAGLSAGLGGA